MAFKPVKSCQMLNDINFKQPFYVKVQQEVITMIEIGIYDGAGQQVPFERDSKTTVRLHFRRCSPSVL